MNRTSKPEHDTYATGQEKKGYKRRRVTSKGKSYQLRSGSGPTVEKEMASAIADADAEDNLGTIKDGADEYATFARIY